MDSLFPTFEEIDKGYQVIRAQGRFKGYDYDGEPVFSKSRKFEVIIAHNTYTELIKSIYYQTDAKGNRLHFKFNLAGNNYAYSFPYCEEGWKDCVDKIKSILSWYNKCIKRILGE